jgi:hypothetical protein
MAKDRLQLSSIHRCSSGYQGDGSEMMMTKGFGGHVGVVRLYNSGDMEEVIESFIMFQYFSYYVLVKAPPPLICVTRVLPYKLMSVEVITHSIICMIDAQT